jgi:hypothetical protein
MKKLIACSITFAVLTFLAERGAEAQNKHLCCDLPAGSASAPCISQATDCSLAETYGVGFTDLTADQVPNVSSDYPGTVDAFFPDGTDGHAFWTAQPPWVGYCLVPPVSADPTHTEPVDPLGCLRASLDPGIGAAILDVVVPVDPQWDAYEFCYGSPDATGSCQGLSDSEDSSVSLTPSHSCCSHALPFLQMHGSDHWLFGIDQEIPAVPPPVLIHDPATGLVAYYDPNPATGDYFTSTADAGCLPQYGEPTDCGSAALEDSVPPSSNDGSVTSVALTSDSDSGAQPAYSSSSATGGCDFSGGTCLSWSVVVFGGGLIVGFSRRRRRAQRGDSRAASEEGVSGTAEAGT